VVIASSATTKYTHLELGKDVIFGIAGYYTPQQEKRLKYNNREVLYTIGQVVLESSCCSIPGSWTYTIVPGYIVNWQDTNNEAGLPVSKVEPIRDNEAKAYIREAIKASEAISLIDFW
jgi:hypothetical protein